MKALDLFCGAGGASMGLYRAGFEVTGVDINPQPHYPAHFEFIQADALEFPLDSYDLIWASPPCQAFTRAQKLQGNDHPDLIAPIRKRLLESGTPYIIENVKGAPLIDPIMLCGSMFALRTYRHRFFEIYPPFLTIPPGCLHDAPTAKMGRPPKEGENMHIVGNFSDVNAGREAMGITWMTRDELSEAIPPAYSKFLAEAFLMAKIKLYDKLTKADARQDDSGER